MPRWLSQIPILLGIAVALQAQNPSPWHGRIIGIEDSPGGQTQNLTFTDLENVSQRGVLTSDSRLNYALDPVSATIYVFRQKFTGNGEIGRSLQIIPLNNLAAAKTVQYPSVCTACPTCGGCMPDQPQMAFSRDGRYVLTAMQRLQVHHAPPPPGQFANDDDASYEEQIIVPYDIAADKFLNVLAGGGWLLPSSEPDGFELLMGNGNLVRYQVAGRELKRGAVVSKLTFPAGRYRETRDQANARTLFLFENGKVMEVGDDHLKQIGEIDPLPASRRMYPAVVTGNGKLLFVPTGPAAWPVNKFAPGAYIDQIDVYDAVTLARLRSLHSQRPLLEVIPNQDGSRLYAPIPGRSSIVVLNSDTLWQEEEHLTQLPIHQVTLLP